MSELGFDFGAPKESEIRKRCREVFLAEMDRLIPWQEMRESVAALYLNPAMAGDVSINPETMLRIYFLQQWYALSDSTVEEALYLIEPMRRFARLDPADDDVPDKAAIAKFRELLERYALDVSFSTMISDLLESSK